MENSLHRPRLIVHRVFHSPVDNQALQDLCLWTNLWTNLWKLWTTTQHLWTTMWITVFHNLIHRPSVDKPVENSPHLWTTSPRLWKTLWTTKSCPQPVEKPVDGGRACHPRSSDARPPPVDNPVDKNLAQNSSRIHLHKKQMNF